MSVVQTIDVFTAQSWPQGDARDPLGVWGFRSLVTGDATGGSLKVTAQAPAPIAAAYVYTCYSVIMVKLSGPLAGTLVKVRLLTNWPNMDPQAGVQSYATAIANNNVGTSGWDPGQVLVPDINFIGPLDRFLLLYDPRPSAGALSLVEVESGGNVDADTWSVEGYGYFWDRSVMNTPGGPRHPGSN